MAIITDKGDLGKNAEVTFDTAEKTIKLNATTTLTSDGVTLQAIYSFCKDLWKTDNDLVDYPFPFNAVTSESYELINGWDFKNDDTRNLVKTGGWSVLDTSGARTEQWAGIITIGELGAGTQVYFKQSSDTTTDFEELGVVNQAIKIFDGSVNERSNLTLFARNQGDTFDQSDLSDIGVTGDMQSQVYRFPLTTEVDTDITLTDSEIEDDTNGYSDITITYSNAPFSSTIGSQSYDFNVTVDGNGQSIRDIYSTLQYQLRQTTDIDDTSGNSQIGEIAGELAYFSGESIKLKEGVLLENFRIQDTNDILHDPIGSDFDIGFPFTASLEIFFNDVLTADLDSKVWVYFSGNFGGISSISVHDSTGADMNALVNQANSVTFYYDYTGNDQRGTGTEGTNANVTVVALGLSGAQYVSATGVIERSTSNTVSLISSLERNFTPITP
jgi:hypothetical protein